jgi:hypothetical protein
MGAFADYGSEHSDNEHYGCISSHGRSESSNRAASDLKRRSLCEVAEEPFVDSIPVPFVKVRLAYPPSHKPNPRPVCPQACVRLTDRWMASLTYQAHRFTRHIVTPWPVNGAYTFSTRPCRIAAAATGVCRLESAS